MSEPTLMTTDVQNVAAEMELGGIDLPNALDSLQVLLQVVARRGTDVYDRPDSAVNGPTARLDEDTPVCASTDSRGFGFRLVKLANGKSGYVEESNLSN